MAETAANLVERVLPHVPVRQWVLTLPLPLRSRAGLAPGLSTAILDIFLPAVFGWLPSKAREAGVVDSRPGAVTLLQTAGGRSNANLHFHSLVLDGVYTRKAAGATPVFQATDAPSESARADILPTVRVKIRRRLPQRRRYKGQWRSAPR